MRGGWRLIQGASIAFVGLMVAGWTVSLWLPDRNRTNVESACYWTDAMLVFVRCGDRAWLGWLREPVYNLYFTMFDPLVGTGHIAAGNGRGWLYLIGGLFAWAAVIITGATLWRAARRRFTLGRRSPR